MLLKFTERILVTTFTNTVYSEILNLLPLLLPLSVSEF